jgi:hypothetical protein
MTESKQPTRELYGLAQDASLSEEAIATFIATSTAHAQVMREVLRDVDQVRRHAESLGLDDIAHRYKVRE